MSESKRGDLTPLGDTLDSVLGRFAGPGHRERSVIFERWRDIAGPLWAHTSPLRLDERGVLTVEVAGGGAASRLRYDAVALVARIEAEVGEGVVETVRLRVARNRA